MIALIDYDAGNIKSVEKAFEFLGCDVVTTKDRNVIMNADRVVLPGVGAFGDAMHRLTDYGLVDVIKEYISAGKPFIGICLGYQLLFEESEESPGVKGLGIFEGRCLKFDDKYGLKIPQIGWNSLSFSKDSKLYKGIKNDTFVYFVHSYYVKADDDSIVSATCEYGNVFHASCEHDNVFGCQFHPEKSSGAGIEMLKNFTMV